MNKNETVGREIGTSFVGLLANLNRFFFNDGRRDRFGEGCGEFLIIIFFWEFFFFSNLIFYELINDLRRLKKEIEKLRYHEYNIS